MAKGRIAGRVGIRPAPHWVRAIVPLMLLSVPLGGAVHDLVFPPPSEVLEALAPYGAQHPVQAGVTRTAATTPGEAAREAWGYILLPYSLTHAVRVVVTVEQGREDPAITVTEDGRGFWLFAPAYGVFLLAGLLAGAYYWARPRFHMP